jgi:alpha-ribazole phosphatase CobZ
LVYPTALISLAVYTTFKTFSTIKEVLVNLNSETLPPLMEYLEKRGITLKDLVNTALELFVPHPGLETEKKAAEMFREEFLDALSDVNISTLEVACFRAQEDAEKGLIPGLSQERFMGRPGLVADELMGLAIANYIAGVRGIFEFTRFDQAKPGILKKLGPITNDAIGGLVAGVSSNVYTRAFRNASKMPQP